jgi:hypothetical protein
MLGQISIYAPYLKTASGFGKSGADIAPNWFFGEWEKFKKADALPKGNARLFSGAGRKGLILRERERERERAIFVPS